MSDDFLDCLMSNGDDAEQQKTGAGWAACGVSAESSEQLEQWERNYLANVKAHPLEYLVTPFLDNDGTLEPSSREEKAILKSCGVSEAEWRELMEQTT